MATARLIVIRHAKSDYPWGVDDHDRPLNDRGRRDAPQVGVWLDEHVQWEPGEEPLVLVSTARRAQLTWSLARAELSERWTRVSVLDEPGIYGASTDALRRVVDEAAEGADTVALVGHNPGLVDLIAELTVPGDLRAEAIAKFPTSAVAILEAEGPLVQAIRSGSAFRVREFAVPRG